MNTYHSHEVVSFLKTAEEFGGLSNMAAGYPFVLYGARCKTSEHLYQALKFPDHPEIQTKILVMPSPMQAKMVARKLDFRGLIRPDWEEIKLAVMDYCLRAKLSGNYERFSDLLLSTGNADIVEISSKNDTFWGCVPDGDLLVGHNHLGVLLTQLRDELIRGGPRAGFRMSLTPPTGVELRLNGRTAGSLPFGLWDEIVLNEILGAIRAMRTKQSSNSTIGGT